LAEMARNVARTLAAVRVERERLEAILRGMVEGVVVTDLTGHVVLLNARARELLDLPPGVDPMGRPLIELVRDPGLADLPPERLGRLIDDLLTLSDLEFGRTPPRRRPLAVEPVIDDVVQILGDRAAQRGIALTTEVDAATPTVDADGDQLRQVLINLVDNAI